MKIKILYTGFLSLFLAFLFYGNSGGRAADQNQGNTGAPGDEVLDNNKPRTCQSCHATGNIQVTMNITILDVNQKPVTTYTPDETYTLQVRINHAAGPVPSGYGFQLVSLFDSLNTDVKGWLAEGHSPNVQIAESSLTKRLYAEHKGVSNSPEFLVKWKAPKAGNGKISFYSCGNGVNKNGDFTGDGAALPVKLTIDENITTNLVDLKNLAYQVNIAPNPAKDDFQLTIHSHQEETLELKLIGLDGRLIHTEIAKVLQGKNHYAIDIDNCESGVYFLNIVGEKGLSTYKIIIEK